MRYLILMKATMEAWAGAPPDRNVVLALRTYSDVLKRAGVLLAAEGLDDGQHGARLFEADGGRRIVDGPFGDAEPLVRGFWLIQAKSRDEALAWATRYPLVEGQILELRSVR